MSRLVSFTQNELLHQDHEHNHRRIMPWTESERGGCEDFPRSKQSDLQSRGSMHVGTRGADRGQRPVPHPDGEGLGHPLAGPSDRAIVANVQLPQEEKRQRPDS